MRNLPSVVFLTALLVVEASAQTTTLNTRLRSHININSTSWDAGNWGYRTATHRYLLQTLGNGLAIVDTTDPANATLVRRIDNISVKEVKVYRNYAYASTDGGPTRIIDLTNPATASVVASISQGTHTLQIDVARGLLFMNRASQNELRILNLAANPTNPPLVVAVPLPDIHDCNIEGNIVYVMGGYQSACYILDTSNLPTVTQIGTFPVPGGYAHHSDLFLARDGRKYLLTCTEITPQTWLKIYDVTNPAAAVLVSQWWTDPNSVIHNVFIKGAYAYISYYKDGLRVLDLTDPAAPVEVGIYDVNYDNFRGNTYSGTWDVYPHHDAVYVGEMYNTVGPGTQGAWIVDFFPGFGSGCPGTGAVVPTQWWSFGPPSPGNAEFALRLADARPNAVAMQVLGFSSTSWAGGALPMGLGAFGAPLCTLYAAPDAVTFRLTDGAGRASQPLPVPPGMSGDLWCQWAVLDPGAPNAAGLAVTNGGILRVH